MKQPLTLLAALAIALLTGCASEEKGARIVSEGTLTVPDVPGQWTYVSLRQGRVLGVCALSDTTAQRQWSQRTDWDVALCNGMIRTNGGASGAGQGGIGISTEPYETADPSVPTPLTSDRDTIAVW